MASLCLSLMPCSIVIFVCLMCCTLCNSAASLNSVNPFHLLKNIGVPMPSILDNPCVTLQEMSKQPFKNLDNIKRKKRIDYNN